MDEKKALQIKNKLHLLTFFITQCEEEDPLEEDENEWHPDFEEAISSILFVNEHGYLNEDQLHKFNDMYSKWSDRFDRLGLSDREVEEWKDGLESEIYDLLEEHYE